MKLIVISDTHSFIPDELPSGDVLIHCGDLTNYETLGDANTCLLKLSAFKEQFKHIILIAGNHDIIAEDAPHTWETICKDLGITYLKDSSITIEGIKFYGTPYSPIFCDWSFMKSERELVDVFNKIPEDTDVLVTHAPPYGILDECTNLDGTIEHCGSRSLLSRVLEVKPEIHVFGHIHDSYGIKDTQYTKYINAAYCNGVYKPINKPVVVEVM